MKGGFSGRGKAVACAALLALLVALLGGLATDIGPWYTALKKPPWQPPDALFGPVWTTIYACAAMAGVYGWERASSPSTNHRARDGMLALFALNAFLNVLWSLLFFRLRRPDWALWEVPLLWLSILVLMMYTARFSPRSAWLLLPYLLWVSFAAVLNWSVVQLNAPWGAR